MNNDRANLVRRFGDLDPATVYEAAGRAGMIDPSIRPAWPGAKLCGVALTVDSPPGDNLMLHQAVAIARPGTVLVAKLGGYLLAGAWGEILTLAAQARGISGLVVDGAVRDIDAIASLGFPVFSRGVAIGSCTKERFGPLNCPMVFGGVSIVPGDIVLGNSDGIVVVERARAEEIYEASMRRRQREAEIIASLQDGRTTVELLGLPEPLSEEDMATR